MLDLLERYYMGIIDILRAIKESERDRIVAAARLVAEKIVQNEVIHVFGTGAHSVIGAMEVFSRAGGLVPINGLFPPGISFFDSHPNLERLEGYAPLILDFYGVKSGDLLFIVNVNGINALTIDTAVEARKRGVTTIAITSPQFSRAVPPGIKARHSSNLNLCDLADLVIDVHVPPGDAILTLPQVERKVGASSTFAVCFALNSIFVLATQIIADQGISPPIWASGNMPGGDEANREFRNKYRSRIYHLYPR